MEEKSKSADAYWGDKYFAAGFPRGEWQAHPLAVERYEKIHDGLDIFSWLVDKHLKGKTVRRGLGVGVGNAGPEIELLEMGAVEHFDLYDINPAGLHQAKICAEEKGLGDRITCHCASIIEVSLPPNTYDAVSFFRSLHHMAQPEPMLTKLHKSLKRGGILWALDEYIGPDRFNFPPEHADIASAFYKALPERFRNPWQPEIRFPTPAEIQAADFTQSICSSQIVPAMKRVFPGVEITPLYGSFAFMLFWGLHHDALYSSWLGVELVRHIIGMDQALVESGVLPNYFAHLVAHKT